MGSLDKASQLGTLHRAIALVQDFSAAVDGGANKGDWLAVMVGHFAKVHAFEPNPVLMDRLREKFGGMPTVDLHHAALWSHPCTVSLNDHPRAPHKHRAKFCTEGGDLSAVTIDSLVLTHCGLVKLDLEGAEMLALAGGRATIVKHHPVVVVECKNSRDGKINEDMPGHFLERIGYHESFRAGPDRVYTWAR